MITAERVRELLDYDPETGVLRWAVRVAQRIRVGDVAGSIHSKGYRRIRINGRLCMAHRLAWLHTHGRWPVHEIDHIDGNPANNRISNLREASRSENNQNQKRYRNNTSGFKGVSWDKPTRSWRAEIKINRRSIYLGLYATAEAAHAAYCEASAKHHGEFGRVA